MNTKLALLPLLALAILPTAACVTQDDIGEGEPVEVSQVESDVTSCTPVITAAAITKQIVSISVPVDLTVELVTITAKPFKLSETSLAHPAGFVQKSLGTTSCVDLGTGWKCRHSATLTATYATSGTGAYSMGFVGIADANSGCWSGATTKVDFSLTTESFGYTTVNGY
jgi:hypothetical protein